MFQTKSNFDILIQTAKEGIEMSKRDITPSILKIWVEHTTSILEILYAKKDPLIILNYKTFLLSIDNLKPYEQFTSMIEKLLDIAKIEAKLCN